MVHASCRTNFIESSNLLHILAVNLVLQTYSFTLTIFFCVQVIVADNFFTGSKDNLKKWIGHPRFELIRHGKQLVSYLCLRHFIVNSQSDPSLHFYYVLYQVVIIYNVFFQMILKIIHPK